MGRRRRKNKRKVRLHCEGRILYGKGKVTTFEHGFFSYRGHIYAIDDFPEGKKVNLDSTKVEPIATDYGESYQVRDKEQPKQKKWKKKFAAQLFSNIDQCPDVRSLL